MTNVSGIAAEKYFNPQFEEVMNNLREVDANIRSIAAGKSLDKGDPGDDPKALKDLLKSAKSNLNRREFMTSVADLGRFHKKVADIVLELGRLQNKVDEVHHQFLFQDLGDEHKKELQNLKSRWASSQQEIVKEANIMDFFHNILSDRGKALSFYEKRYEKQVKPLRAATTSMLAQSERVLNHILTTLKEMASSRATRNPDKYIAGAQKIQKIYQSYDQTFKAYYSDKIKPFEKFFQNEQEVAVSPATQEERGPNWPFSEFNKAPVSVPDLDLPYSKQTPEAKNRENALSKLDKKYGPPDAQPTQPNIPQPPATPTNVGPVIPPPPDTEPNLPPNFPPHKDPDMPETLRPKKSHEQFYNSLQSMADEHPTIVASFIRKYAQSIQGSDPETAIRLLQVVKSRN